MEVSEFKASLIHPESSGPALASQRNPVSTQNKNSKTPSQALHSQLPEAPTSRSGVSGSPRPALTEERGGRRNCRSLRDSTKTVSGKGVPSSTLSDLGDRKSQAVLGSKGCWSSCMLGLSMAGGGALS